MAGKINKIILGAALAGTLASGTSINANQVSSVYQNRPETTIVADTTQNKIEDKDPQAEKEFFAELEKVLREEVEETTKQEKELYEKERNGEITRAERDKAIKDNMNVQETLFIQPILDEYYEHDVTKISKAAAEKFGHLVKSNNPLEYFDQKLRPCYDLNGAVENKPYMFYEILKPAGMRAEYSDGRGKEHGQITFASVDDVCDEAVRVKELVFKMTNQKLVENDKEGYKARVGLSTFHHPEGAYSISKKNSAINNGAAELMTEKLLDKKFGEELGESDNEFNLFIVKQMAELLGEDAIFDGMLNGPEALQQQMDKVAGKGSYEKLAASMDVFNTTQSTTKGTETLNRKYNSNYEGLSEEELAKLSNDEKAVVQNMLEILINPIRQGGTHEEKKAAQDRLKEYCTSKIGKGSENCDKVFMDVLGKIQSAQLGNKTMPVSKKVNEPDKSL